MSDSNDNRGPGIIAAAIIGAALILSWGMGKSEPRYQIASSGDGIVRMDTDSGELIACTAQGCRRIEQPDRAKTFGPLTIEVGDDAKKKAPPAPAN
jgi:hypothetical protein